MTACWKQCSRLIKQDSVSTVILHQNIWSGPEVNDRLADSLKNHLYRSGRIKIMMTTRLYHLDRGAAKEYHDKSQRFCAFHKTLDKEHTI